MSKLMKEMDDNCDVSCSADGNDEMCRTHFKMFKTHNSSRIGIFFSTLAPLHGGCTVFTRHGPHAAYCLLTTICNNTTTAATEHQK